MTGRTSDSEALDLPRRTDLPYFAYGLFKPGELAHRQVEPLLNGDPVLILVPGTLYVRDGLPLLKLGGTAPVSGYLMVFREGTAEEAYAKISAFEPRKHYEWGRVELGEAGQLANVLVGRRPELGSAQLKAEEWTVRQDPVLTEGLAAVGEVADLHACEEFASAPEHAFDWSRLFKLQMAYLFLWTVIERYTALAYGPALNPSARIRRLGEEPAFARAVKSTVTRTGRVYDPRDPGNRAVLDPDRSVSSAKYYYAVRSNLSHRGKGAWQDGEITRRSINELLTVMRSVLEKRL